jgi:hypothetical protein
MDSFQSLLALRNQHPNAIALWVLVGKQVKIEARVPVMPSKAATKSEKDNIANCCGPVMPMGRVWVGTCGEWEDRKRKGGERKGGEKEKQRNKETKRQRDAGSIYREQKLLVLVTKALDCAENARNRV